VRWLAKAGLQKLLGLVPGASTLNYRLQLRSGGLPFSDEKVLERVAEAVRHFEAYRQHGPSVEPTEARFFEFGAGWDLAVPLTYHLLGVARQTIVDIEPKLRLELTNDVIAKLARNSSAMEALAGRTLDRLSPVPVRSVEELEQRFGIEYQAPADVRHTGLPAGSFRFVSNTNTLEHIPEGEIGAILRECRRLLAPDGVISSSIDMQDHFSYFEPSLSPYHFLRFSDRTWRLLSSPLNYQNRLRRPDYLRLFRDSGLEVVSERCTRPKAGVAQLESMRLAKRFREGYALDDLAVGSMHVVARAAQ